FPWQQYLRELGFPALRDLNVMVPDFFVALDKLITQEPLPNLQHYLRWHALHSAAPTLGKAFVDENFRFYSQRLTGTDKILPRWKRCVVATERALGEALAAPFIRKRFGEAGKTAALELINGIEAEMRKNLGGLSWMDEATRSAARVKLDRIFNKIG